MTILRKQNFAGFYDDQGRFRPIRSPEFVGSGKRKRKATKRDKKQYSRVKAGDLGKKRQARALEDPWDKELRIKRENEEKDRRHKERLTRQLEREVYGGGSMMSGGKPQTLVQFVRAAGGIRRTRYDRGELENFTFKQSGKRGLVTDKGGKTLDGMFQDARQSGFDVTSPDDLLDKLDNEIRGYVTTYATHGELDYRDNPMQKKVKRLPSFRMNEKVTDKISGNWFYFVSDFRGISDLIVPATGKAVQIPTDRLIKGWKSEVAGNPKKKRNSPSARKLAKIAIDVFDVDSDRDVDAADLKILEAITRKLRSKKKTRVKKNPVGWFKGVTTADEVKKLYKKLASQWHPDKATGDLRTMQQINADYDKAIKLASSNEGNSFRADAETKAAKPLREAIEFAVTLPDNIDVVIRGLWLWLEGNTYAVKDKIKAFKASDGNQFKFASKKKAWFFAAVPSSNRRGEMSFEEIDRLHGKELVNERKRRLSLNPKKKRAKRKNPMHPITAFATGASGILSALQIKEMVSRQKVKARPRRKNPVRILRRRTFEMFQGRKPEKAVRLEVSRFAPARLDQLGDLIELKLNSGQVLKFNGKKFKLCAARGKLWIAGGKFAKPNPSGPANVLNAIDQIAHVVYGTYKPHHGDNVYTHYIHKLGEDTGHRPTLAVDRDGFPVVWGGKYKIEARGIVN